MKKKNKVDRLYLIHKGFCGFMVLKGKNKISKVQDAPTDQTRWKQNLHTIARVPRYSPMKSHPNPRLICLRAGVGKVDVVGEAPHLLPPGFLFGVLCFLRVPWTTHCFKYNVKQLWGSAEAFNLCFWPVPSFQHPFSLLLFHLSSLKNEKTRNLHLKFFTPTLLPHTHVKFCLAVFAYCFQIFTLQANSPADPLYGRKYLEQEEVPHPNHHKHPVTPMGPRHWVPVDKVLRSFHPAMKASSTTSLEGHESAQLGMVIGITKTLASQTHGVAKTWTRLSDYHFHFGGFL